MSEKVQRTPSPIRNQRMLSPEQSGSPSLKKSASKIEPHVYNLNPYNLKSYANLDQDNDVMANNNKYQANKLLDAQTQTDNLSQRLKNKYLQSDLQTSKILAQEKDIILLSKNYDDKNKTFGILKEKLDQMTADAYQIAADKNTIFNNLEQLKYDGHNNIVDMQTKFNNTMRDKNEKISCLMNKYNRCEEELEKTKMSYRMQLANELLESEKNITNNTKTFRLKVNEIDSIGYKNCQTLKKNNDEMNQCKNELEKNNNLLIVEKLLLENELKLCDKNNDDARKHLKEIETDLDIVINAAEAEQLTNHGLKQNQIDLKGKIDLLKREQHNLELAKENLTNENSHLSLTLEKVQRQLFETNNICDELRLKNIIADENCTNRNDQLENMKKETSKMTLDYENELTDINQILNNICSKHNILMREIEKKQQECCHEHEVNKNNIINDHNQIKHDKDTQITELNNDLDKDRKFYEDAILNLTTQTVALNAQLANTTHEQSNVQCDLRRTFDSQLSEIQFLQAVNNNLINEIKIKDNEINQQIATIDCELKDTSINGNKTISAKDQTNDKLLHDQDTLTNECASRTEINRDLTVIKNDLSSELDKIKYNYDLLREELSTQINLLNHSIRDITFKFDTQRHDRECQRLSRDETLRTIEEKLKNLHEDRNAREKEQMFELSELKIKIEEKDKEHESYRLDTESQVSLLENNNSVKDLKISGLERDLIDLDKMYCTTRMKLERGVLDLNNDIISCDKELDNAFNQIKVQSQSLSELNNRNTKLTSELVQTQDTHNRDRKYFDIKQNKQNKELSDLNIALNKTNQNRDRLANERLDILSMKELETQRLKQETDRICDELTFERNKRLEADTLDRFNYNRIKEMEDANEQWRNKQGVLEREKRDAMLASTNSRIELAEVKEIINRYKQ